MDSFSNETKTCSEKRNGSTVWTIFIAKIEQKQSILILLCLKYKPPNINCLFIEMYQNQYYICKRTTDNQENNTLAVWNCL